MHTPDTTHPTHSWLDTLWPTVLLVALVTAARIAYLIYLSPYDLVEDEAQYWDWARNLSLSYYTKGPGIAWTIALAQSILHSSAEWAIRLPAPLFSAITALAVAALTADAGRVPDPADPSRTRPNHRAGLIAAVCILLAPVYQATALLMTIDGPMLAAWATAAWAGHRMLLRRSGSAAIVLPLALGIGFLYKYTILLLVPGLLLFLLIRPRSLATHRKLPQATPVMLALLIACTLPVIIWNAANDWPTVSHLLGHIGAAEGSAPAAHVSESTSLIDWTRFPARLGQLLATQLGIVGPLLLLTLIATVWALRPSNHTQPVRLSLTYLLCLAAPVLLLYLAVTLVADVEGNWPIAAYITLIPIAALMLADHLPRYRQTLRDWRDLPAPRPKRGLLRKRPETPVHALWTATLIYGITAALLAARLDILASLPYLGKHIPTGRLMHNADMGTHAGELLDQLAADTNQQPLLMAQHYGRAALLAYYTPGQPRVYSTSSLMGGRTTPYDFFTATDITNPALAGRPALVVGATREQWLALFAVVEPIGSLRSEHKAHRPAFLAYDYAPPLTHPPSSQH